MKKHILLTTAFIAGASALFAQTGNVGIGTTTPGARLDVKGAGITNATRALRALNGNDSTMFTVLNNGIAAIGKANPLATLDVKGSSSGNVQFFRVADIIDSSRFSIRNGLFESTSLMLNSRDNTGQLSFSASSTTGSGTAINSTKILSINVDSAIYFRSAKRDFIFANNGANSSIPLMRLLNGDLSVGVGGPNPIDNIPTARLDVKTAASDTSKAVHVRDVNNTALFTILNNGNIGISTVTPATKLHVAGNVRIADGTQGLNKIFSSDADGTGSWKTAAELGLGGNSGWALEGNSLTGSEILGSTNALPLRIVTDSTERMRVTETGRVVIGTTTANAMLDVKSAAGNNPYFRIADANDTMRLLVTNRADIVGANTELRLRPSDGSSTLTLQASPNTVVYDYLRSTTNLGLWANNTLQLRSDSNKYDFGITTSGIVARLWDGNLGLGLNFSTETMGARLDIKTAASDTSKAMRIRNANNDALLTVLNNGFISIGNINPVYKLDVVGDINASGSVRANGIALTSDARLKRNITNIANGLNTVMALHPVAYEKKNNIRDSQYDRHEIGFIAQEVAKVLPSLVKEGKDENKTLSVSYIELIPVLTKAIQEQQEQIKELKATNEQLAKLAGRTDQAEKAYADLAAEVKEMQQMLGISKLVSGSKVAGK